MNPMTPDLAALEAHAHCPNCENTLSPPPALYCAFCGQEAHVRPPTMAEFAQEWGEHFVSTEGSIWRSLRLLLTKPGQLTREYWQGRRKRYVSPLRLYLTISVVVLLVFKLAGTTHMDAATEAKVSRAYAQGESFLLVGVNGYGAMSVKQGVLQCDYVPHWICQRVENNFRGDPATVVHWMLGVFDRAADHTGQAMFFLLPLFAVWLKLLYRGQSRFYTEHLVLALHLHALWFVTLLIAAVPVAGAKPIGLVVALLYLGVALQTVFGGAVWKNMVRAAALAVVHGAAMLVTLYAMLIWAFAA